jgi:MoaA/NifB/PqqE/SkfB family radical SAM enzyme
VPDVATKLLSKVLDTFPTIRSACVAGFGEPLCSKVVFDNIRYLISRKVGTSLITNGSLVSARFDEMIGIKFEYVNISVNALPETKYQEITGMNTFQTVLEGIRKLVSLKSFPVTMSYVCFKNNVDDIPQFITLCNECNISYGVVVNNLPYDESCLSGIIRDTDKYIIEKINQYKTLPGAKIIRKWPIPVKTEPNRKCNSPVMSIGINGAGLFTGCRRCLPPSEPFDKKCWESKYINELRRSVKGNGIYSKYCNHCFGNSK